LVRRSECVPKSRGSSPTLPIHSATRRAYCRVVILRSAPRRPVNKNSPGLLLATFDRLAGLFAQFESDWPSRLLLPNRCAVGGVSARSDILDLDCGDVTATQLAVDRQIEHGEVPSAPFDLEFRPNRPDVFGAQRRLCSGHLALVPRHSLNGRGGRIHLILHGHTPRLGYRGGEHVPLVRHR
jgi:hypothetical protein